MASSSSSGGAAPSSSLSLFWDLASPQEEKRIASSSQLVSTLLSQQSTLVATTSRSTLDGKDQPPSDASAQEVESYLDRCLASEVSYSLRRLIRGLASPRQQSRLGFSVALTELLSNVKTLVRPGHILTLLRKYSTPSGSIDGFEQRNLLFARLFGVHVIVRSGLLLTASTQEVAAAVDLLVELAETKAWMRECSAWELVEMLQAARAASQDGAASSTLKDDVLRAVSAYATSADITAEKLALLLELPGKQHSNLKPGHPLSSANLPAIAKILRNASATPAAAAEKDDETAESSSAARQDRTGAHNPRCHFVWDTILSSYSSPSSPSSKGIAPLSDFWRLCVDDSLFSPTATPERKSWGFQIFSKALPLLPASEKPLLLSQNFMRSWINQLASNDRLLHKAAVHAAEVVQATVQESPRAGFALVVQLLGKHGNHNFDKLTRTKTIENLLATMDEEGVDQYVRHVVGETISAANSEDARRRWGLDQLLNLVRNTAVPTSDECVRDILSYLVAGGLFAWKKPGADATKKGSLLALPPKPAFSNEVKGLCRSRWLSCLTDLMERTTTVVAASAGEEGGKTRRVQGVDSKGVPWLRTAWDIVQSLSKDTKTFSSSVEDEQVKQAVSAGSQLLATVQKQQKNKKSTQKDDRSEAFETLVIATLLYIYEASPSDAGDLVAQLSDCQERLLNSRVPASKDGEEEEEDITGIELLLDYLVGLLERPSAFLRAVTEHVFAAFVPEMNRAGVEHLVDQLGLNEEQEGAEGDEDGEEEDEEMEDGEADTSATSSDSDDEDEEDDDDDDEDDNEEVDEDFRNAVSAVLKAAGVADDDSSDDDNDDEEAQAANKDAEVDADATVTGNDDASSDNESLPDLTDDQMMELDDRLGDVFRSHLQSRKSKGGQSKEAKAESVAFQHKVLDLLAIFAKKRSSSSREVLLLVRPLFVLAAEGEEIDKSLAAKAAGVLRGSICKAKEVPQVTEGEDEAAAMLEDLEAVHGLARRTTSNELASLANTVNQYLTRVSLNNGTTTTTTIPAPLLTLYTTTTKDFLHRSASQLKPAFLLDALKRFPRLAWQLRGTLLEGCSLSSTTSTVKAFRQQQAYGMLLAVLSGAAAADQALQTELLSKALPEVASVVFASLSAAVAGGGGGDSTTATPASAGKVKELLKFALQAVRLTQKVGSSSSTTSPEAVRSIWKPAKIREALDGLGKSDQFKQSTSLLGLLKQMLAVVEGAAGEKNKKKERRQSDANGDGEGKAKKKQKMNGAEKKEEGVQVKVNGSGAGKAKAAAAAAEKGKKQKGQGKRAAAA